jgi:alpha-tubulin suppressor-like RCC1 family protein
MASGYKFPILNIDGSASTTVVDFDDMFVSKDQFLTSGLWMWGRNQYGNLGYSPSGVSTSSPIQVGTLTNWKSLTCGQDFGGAIKTDGTLWMWGHNAYGALGQGNILHRSSPVQVGTQSYWKLISGGVYHLSLIHI